MNIITYILLLYILRTYVYIIFFALYIYSLYEFVDEKVENKLKSNQIIIK